MSESEAHWKGVVAVVRGAAFAAALAAAIGTTGNRQAIRAAVARIEADPDPYPRERLAVSLRAKKLSSKGRTEQYCVQFRPVRVPLWFWRTGLV